MDMEKLKLRVTIDRPIGFEDDYGNIYPINYGFVPGVIGGDGEILAYRISEHPNTKTIIDAQKEAMERTDDCPYRRTFHSDQGWAYQMKAYKKQLA